MAEGLPLRPRGRVPGHEPRAVPAAAAPGRRARQRLRGRRPRPVDLRIPRRGHPQHPRVRARLRRRADDRAGAELPLDERDPARGQLGDRQQPRAQAEEPLQRPRRGRPRAGSSRSRTSTPRRATSPPRSPALGDEGVAGSEIAVFYRTNAQSRVLEDVLVRQEIPYQVIGGPRFYERAEIKDAVAYLQVIDNPFDGVSLGRIANKPRRGIGDASIARLQASRTRRASRSSRLSARPTTPESAPRRSRPCGGFHTLHAVPHGRRARALGARASREGARAAAATSRRSRPSGRSRRRAASRT